MVKLKIFPTSDYLERSNFFDNNVETKLKETIYYYYYCYDPWTKFEKGVSRDFTGYWRIALFDRVRGGMHGQILLRACTVYISDSGPDKSGSLPGSSRTNPTPDNFVFHTKNTNLKFFSAEFRSQLSLFVCIAFVTKKIYTTFFIIWFYNFQ